ncbi:unnamed protein product [Arabis nemorensis]|uniref:Uncharacterized protein n=1 Tax=Arabis nemorensis TaxID=586526 RepID=A0A565B455_9BRAS|nr:unnamed protein product [Arabis nemorensis]
MMFLEASCSCHFETVLSQSLRIRYKSCSYSPSIVFLDVYGTALGMLPESGAYSSSTLLMDVWVTKLDLLSELGAYSPLNSDVYDTSLDSFWVSSLCTRKRSFSVLFLAGEGTTRQQVPVDFILILARSCNFLGLTHNFPVTSLFKLDYVHISSSVKERYTITTSLECVHKSSAVKTAMYVLLPVIAEELEIDLLAIDSEALFKRLSVCVYDSNRVTYLLKSILTHPGSILDSLSISFIVILFYVFIAFNRCILLFCKITI